MKKLFGNAFLNVSLLACLILILSASSTISNSEIHQSINNEEKSPCDPVIEPLTEEEKTLFKALQTIESSFEYSDKVKRHYGTNNSGNTEIIQNEFIFEKEDGMYLDSYIYYNSTFQETTYGYDFQYSYSHGSASSSEVTITIRHDFIVVYNYSCGTVSCGGKVKTFKKKGNGYELIHTEETRLD